MAKRDPWADRPDRFDRADRAWKQKWADTPPEPDDDVDPPPAGYRNEKVTADRVSGAYGDGMLAAGPHLGFGMQLAAGMLFFVGLGIAVDRWLGTTPWGVVVGAALGMVGVMTLVVRFAKAAEGKTGRAGRGEGE